MILSSEEINWMFFKNSFSKSAFFSSDSGLMSYTKYFLYKKSSSFFSFLSKYESHSLYSIFLLESTTSLDVEFLLFNNS